MSLACKFTRTLRRRALAGASAAAIGWAVATAALALPANPSIFANSPFAGTAATFTPAAGSLTVTQNAERVVIDWDSFNIANGETVNFVQGADNFIAFNRVDPASFTTIDGNLIGNGSVWVFSPGGLLFGANAQVNVGSLFAGTGVFADFEANASVDPSDLSIFVPVPPSYTGATLTVASGAELNANRMLVLQGPLIDMHGTVQVPNGGVGYIVAEGGSVTIASSPAAGITLLDAQQASDVSGRGQPGMDHTGVTQAQFIEIEGAALAEANFETVINLDGVIDASGASPSAFGIWVSSGHSTIDPTTNGSTTNIVVQGALSTASSDVQLNGDDVQINGSVVGGDEVFVFAYGDIGVDGTVASGGQTMMHAHADDSHIHLTGDIDAGGPIDIATTNADTYIYVDATLTSNALVAVRSGGDIHVGGSTFLTGDANGDGVATGLGVNLVTGTAFNTHTSTTYVSAGDLTIDAGAQMRATNGAPQQILLTAINGDMTMNGQLEGSRVVVRGNGVVTVGGQVHAREDVSIVGWTGQVTTAGDDIVITGTAVLEGDNRVFVSASYGDVTIQDGAELVSDADNTPTLDLFSAPQLDSLFVICNGRVHIEAGASLEAGANYMLIYADGVDAGTDQADAAIVMSGDMHANDLALNAYNGSIVIDGGVHAEDHAIVSAGSYVVLTQNSTVHAGQNPVQAHDALVWPYADVAGNISLLINAGDIALYGEIETDTIAIVANSQGPVLIGGGNGGADIMGYDLGGEFFLTNDEFQTIDAGKIMIVAGADGQDTLTEVNNDMIVRDLTIDPGVVDTLVLGTDSEDTVFVTGAVTLSAPGATALWIGGALQPHGASNAPSSIIPDHIVITGSIGEPGNSFGEVHLTAFGDIGMGSEEFVYAAADDPDFNAFEQSGDFDIDEGHVFIAAGSLTITTNGRVLQQNTGADGSFAGLLIGSPSQERPLIWGPDVLQGVAIGGDDPFTISFTEGPDRVELFGSFVTTGGPVEGPDAAKVSFLAEDFSSEGPMFFNGCAFGGGACGGGAPQEVPQFVAPTQVATQDTSAIEQQQKDQAADDKAAPDDEDADDAEDDSSSESEDEDNKLFRALIAPGTDRAYDQERIGQPITGSGNEDLWTGRGDGEQP
jgi:filamentous hemagglutinin family protein